MIYLVSYGISFASLCLFPLVTLKFGNKRIKLRLGEIITVIVFSIITSARDYSVGVDTINYYYSSQNVLVSSSSITEFIRNYYLEPGYGLLEWICIKQLGDFHYLLLFESIVLLLGLFSFIHCFEKDISIPLAFTVFFALYYNTSLNISRQYIAVGIGLFAAKYLLSNKLSYYFMICTVAVLFHSSALLLFITPFIFKYIKDESNINTYILRITIVCFIIALICVFIEPVTNVLVNTGIIPAKYAGYFHVSDASSSLVLTVLANAPITILVFVLFDELLSLNKVNRQIIPLLFMGLILTMVNIFYGNIGRLAVFWTIWQIVLFPECFEIIIGKNKEAKYRFVTGGLFVLLFLTYWFYCVIVRGFGGTLPYHSDIIDFLNY